jgi:hypothetical protein
VPKTLRCGPVAHRCCLVVERGAHMLPVVKPVYPPTWARIRRPQSTSQPSRARSEGSRGSTTVSRCHGIAMRTHGLMPGRELDQAVPRSAPVSLPRRGRCVTCFRGNLFGGGRGTAEEDLRGDPSRLANPRETRSLLKQRRTRSVEANSFHQRLPPPLPCCSDGGSRLTGVFYPGRAASLGFRGLPETSGTMIARS